MTKLLLKYRTIRKESEHDKKWLEVIVCWAPQGGISLIEQMRWKGLAQKITELPDDNKDCEIELSNKDVVLIEDRLINPQFLMTGLSFHFLQFVLDMKSVLGLRRLSMDDTDLKSEP